MPLRPCAWSGDSLSFNLEDGFFYPAYRKECESVLTAKDGVPCEFVDYKGNVLSIDLIKMLLSVRYRNCTRLRPSSESEPANNKGCLRGGFATSCRLVPEDVVTTATSIFTPAYIYLSHGAMPLASPEPPNLARGTGLLGTVVHVPAKKA